MEVFIIEIVDADNVHMDLLKEFQKREIQDLKKWNEHCFSYLMTDRILKYFYQIEDREIVFDGNKPKLKNNKKYFNISRTSKYVAICFSDSICSVNIEKISEEKDKIDNLSTKKAKYKLSIEPEKIEKIFYEDYIVTLMSDNKDEKVETYIQSGEVFPN